MPDVPKPPSSFLPAVALAALIGLMLCGYWGFPYLQHWMNRNDCVATGRTNC